MPSLNMISEEQATGRIREIYEDIKAQLGIDYVPKLYKAMAAQQGYLEANWHKADLMAVESEERPDDD
jgi:hypothetical protein